MPGIHVQRNKRPALQSLLGARGASVKPLCVELFQLRGRCVPAWPCLPGIWFAAFSLPRRLHHHKSGHLIPKLAHGMPPGDVLAHGQHHLHPVRCRVFFFSDRSKLVHHVQPVRCWHVLVAWLLLLHRVPGRHMVGQLHRRLGRRLCPLQLGQRVCGSGRAVAVHVRAVRARLLRALAGHGGLPAMLARLLLEQLQLVVVLSVPKRLLFRPGRIELRTLSHCR